MNGVLVDTSVWIAHFQKRNPVLVTLLESQHVLIHPMVWGELACGTPPNRIQTLHDLQLLASTNLVAMKDVVSLIQREHLFGVGCGLVDLTLLASTLATPSAMLWTLDKRLEALAVRFNVAYKPLH